MKNEQNLNRLPLRGEEKLREVDEEILNLGTACKQSLERLLKRLEGTEPRRGDDRDWLDCFRSRQEWIARQSHELELTCTRLLLHRQPIVAGDLRLVTAGLRMAGDLQRIGEQAAAIAQLLAERPEGNLGGHLLPSQMAKACLEVLHLSLDAYARRDLHQAYAAIAADDVVDGFFLRIKCGIKEWITLDGFDDGLGLDLLMVAKYFERIADHAVNLARWLIYTESGEEAEAEGLPHP